LVSAVALFLVGALPALLTGRTPLLSGGRMRAVGRAAAGVTYAAGRVLGVAIGG
jgi:VIT1/CCC1 family predicted Fe2+/Mn2+ transporter